MQPQKRNFDSPDEQFEAGKSTVAIIHAGGVTHKRIFFDVGWRWSDDVRLEDEESLCSLMHNFVHVSGRLGVKMADGVEYEFGPGDVSVIPPGHDAWVAGDEPVIVIDHTPVTPAKKPKQA